MPLSLSQKSQVDNIGFSVFDQFSYSDKALAFNNVLSADLVRELFADHDVLFGYGEDDIWNTGLTLWSFIGQVLQDGKQRSCNAAVTHATRYMIEHGLTPPGPDSGEYCRARYKLNSGIVRKIVQEMATQMARATPDRWLWHDKDVKLVDGFTFTMPDTEANQKTFPQLKSQKPGVGFPIARACTVMSLTNACIADLAIGPYQGKNTGETALLREVLDCFNPGDVMLADRYFCSYWMLAILKTREVDCCIRLHQFRDFSKARKIGKNDCIDTWHKPQRAKWMSQELYDSLPDKLDIRICSFAIKSGEDNDRIDVATTLTDPEEYPAKEIGRLYDYRWHVELDIYAIKQTLNLDHVRCKRPEMVKTEMWTTLLAYNMVRLVCARAAYVHDKLPRQMSFTIACNVMLTQWIMPPREEIRAELEKYNLFQIARNVVGNRPGRIEPRVVKRRPKSFALMTQPRHAYQQEM